jgi:hypothetical protein
MSKLKPVEMLKCWNSFDMSKLLKLKFNHRKMIYNLFKLLHQDESNGG